MKVIFGLGNPGLEYKQTRHNVGFMVIDKLAQRQKIVFKRSLRFEAFFAAGVMAGEDISLVKPRTFMNRSGSCVRNVLSHYRLTTDKMLVVYDDADLPLGAIRFRKKGSSAGHQGMASIIERTATQDIARLRIGIGKSSKEDLARYVLDEFSTQEKTVIEEAIEKSVSACIDWVNYGGDYVMQQYNKTGGKQ
ncbi:MAG: aminoacyl-tRNA hydrolase [Candidatus Omnitrophota bacterium]